jgi:hypothetical protein
MILVVMILLFFSIRVDDLVVFGGPSLFSLGPLLFSLTFQPLNLPSLTRHDLYSFGLELVFVLVFLSLILLAISFLGSTAQL